MNQLPYSTILKTKIHVLNMQSAVDYLDQNLEQLGGGYVCVSNVHTTVMSYRDPEYRAVQNASVMNLPDGKPISLVQKWGGCQGAERVPGPDLMTHMFALSEKKGYSHFFFGSSQETLEELRKKLQTGYPAMRIAGMFSPPFRELTEREDLEMTELIRQADADFIWVGLGAPKQEKWMAAHRGCFRGVMLGVGAGFDFHAGTVKRAPIWMQELCLEWLFRIFQDPRRLLPRYLDTNFAFLWYLWKEKRTGHQEDDSGSSDEALRSDRPLKIAMIGHKRIPSREGGVEIVVDELSTRLVKRGHQVDAYNRHGYHVSGKAFDESRGKSYEGIRLITVPTFRNSNLNAIVYTVLGSIRILFGRYDIVHYHAEGPCSMLWLPRLFGMRVIATIHGLDWERSKWGGFATRFLLLGEKIAAKYADEIIVLSENVQRYFLDTYGRQTNFIPNGITRPQLAEAEEISRIYGLEKDSYILFLARIVPEKGVHYLLDAFARVETKKKLVIAGGISHSKEYMDQIRSQAARDSRVIMTDFVQGRVLQELCSNAYLFVIPSDVEGMAMSLLEAMSYGNCCLVSDIPENIEVVGNHAVSFRKSDVKDLQEKLEWLLKRPDVVEEYRKNSADYICERYNWEQVTDRTLEVYER